MPFFRELKARAKALPGLFRRGQVYDAKFAKLSSKLVHDDIKADHLFVVLTDRPVIGVDRHEVKRNDRTVMRAIARAFEKTMNSYDKTQALPRLDKRIDVVCTDVSSLGKGDSLKVKAGYKLVLKKGKKKWKAMFHKWEGRKAYTPTTVFTRVDTHEYTERIRKARDQGGFEVLNPPEFSDVSGSKKRSYEALAAKNIPTPKTFFVNSEQDALDAISKIPSKIIMTKPVKGGGGRRVEPFKRAELKRGIKEGLFDLSEEMVFQEYLGDDAYTNNIRVLGFTSWDEKAKKVISFIPGLVARIGTKGRMSSFTQGSRHKKMKLNDIKNFPLMQMARKAIEAVAYEAGTLPQMVGLDIGAGQIIEVNNNVGALHRHEATDKHFDVRLGQALLSSALDLHEIRKKFTQ